MSTAKLQKFWEENDQKILAVLAIFLTAVVSFQAGKSYENEVKPAEIKVSLNQSAQSNPAEEKIKVLGETMQRKGIEGQTDASGSAQGNSNPQVANTECPLVGSKNSDKYHLSSCSYAAKIKPENRVCFSSDQDAQAKGYKPAQCCH